MGRVGRAWRECDRGVGESPWRSVVGFLGGAGGAKYRRCFTVTVRPRIDSDIIKERGALPSAAPWCLDGL